MPELFDARHLSIADHPIAAFFPGKRSQRATGGRPLSGAEVSSSFEAAH
jgi:hypothetical protein